jgi:hypothetical protein
VPPLRSSAPKGSAKLRSGTVQESNGGFPKSLNHSRPRPPRCQTHAPDPSPPSECLPALTRALGSLPGLSQLGVFSGWPPPRQHQALDSPGHPQPSDQRQRCLSSGRLYRIEYREAGCFNPAPAAAASLADWPCPRQPSDCQGRSGSFRLHTGLTMVGSN